MQNPKHPRRLTRLSAPSSPPLTRAQLQHAKERSCCIQANTALDRPQSSSPAVQCTRAAECCATSSAALKRPSSPVQAGNEAGRKGILNRIDPHGCGRPACRHCSKLCRLLLPTQQSHSQAAPVLTVSTHHADEAALIRHLQALSWRQQLERHQRTIHARNRKVLLLGDPARPSTSMSVATL